MFITDNLDDIVVDIVVVVVVVVVVVDDVDDVDLEDWFLIIKHWAELWFDYKTSIFDVGKWFQHQWNWEPARNSETFVSGQGHWSEQILLLWIYIDDGLDNN